MKKTTNLLAAALLLPGLVCAPGASAIDTERTTAFSFPCDIVFHAEDGRDLTLDGAEYKTLNYKGRTFVPLRAFAELLGADVAFTGAGADGVNRIDLRLAGKAPAITPERAEAGGLIDLYDLRYDTETSPGEAFLRSGMLRVNGDLDGGAITLWHAGHENVAPLRIPGAHPIVLNETAEPLRAGDIRPFVIGENIAGNILFKVETPPYAYGSESVSANAPGPLLSFSFHPYGYMSLKSVPDFDLGNAWFTLYSPPGEEGAEDAFFRPMRCHRFDCTIASLARDMPADAVLTTEPFGVDLRIYRSLRTRTAVCIRANSFWARNCASMRLRSRGKCCSAIRCCGTVWIKTARPSLRATTCMKPFFPMKSGTAWTADPSKARGSTGGPQAEPRATIPFRSAGPIRRPTGTGIRSCCSRRRAFASHSPMRASIYRFGRTAYCIWTDGPMSRFGSLRKAWARR
jgi:hypothetical protein